VKLHYLQRNSVSNNKHKYINKSVGNYADAARSYTSLPKLYTKVPNNATTNNITSRLRANCSTKLST